MAAKDTKAVIRSAGDDFFIAISPSGHAIAIDPDRERAAAPGPMELLLIALGSCTAVDVVNILSKKREHVTEYRVEVSGVRRDDDPRSYNRLQVHHVVTGKGVSSKAVAHAIELSETKYCSVAATLRPAAEITSTFEVIEAS